LNSPVVIYGSSSVFEHFGKLLGEKVSFQEIDEVKKGLPPGIFLINVCQFDYGYDKKETGLCQLEYLKRAIADAKEGKISCLVTLPVNKYLINLNEKEFFGHTEYLAKSFSVKNYAMMLFNEHLRVVLLTTHIPLSEVPKHIKSEKILEKLKLINKHFPEAKICVCALNPHAGEGGLIGSEEAEIERAVFIAKELGIKAFGPIPSDTAFYRTIKGEFDIVLALYHDQGLIPVKLTDFESAVNLTLGLPIIRTSPAHGTAYEIAGKGIASTKSFRKSVEWAWKLARGMSLLSVA
jgi:4-hydroxythreonine-4-phosphate dehydrogenase